MASTTGDRRRLGVSAVSAALALAGIIAMAWALLHQQGDPPAPPPASAATSSASGEPGDSAAVTRTPGSQEPDTAAVTEAPEPQADAEQEDAATSSAAQTSAPAEPEPLSMASSEPTAVRLDSIDVASDLHALGLTEQGTLEVPSGQRYGQAAWYEGSPTPGQIGPAVIEGHVTRQGSIPSVFFDLGAVTVGDQIEVDRADGSAAVFEVYDTGSFPKDDFPSLAVYGRTNQAELRVITCGGDYSAEQRRHVDNVVVFARLVDAA